MSPPYAPPPPLREAAGKSAGEGIDKDQSTRGPRQFTKTSTYRTGTPVRHRPIPGHLSRRAIEASPALTYLASREPEDTEQWSDFWQKRHLR